MSSICEDYEEPRHSKPGRIPKEYQSGVLAGYQALEPPEPRLDLQQLLDDDDVGLLGVDPYGAVFAGDQLFDLAVVRCGNLRIHVGNDTRDIHNLLEPADDLSNARCGRTRVPGRISDPNDQLAEVATWPEDKRD